MGFRYRLHVRRLVGTPDIVLPRHRKVIFVHGCFWHGHEGCARSKRPATNKKFWNIKIDANIERDRKVREELADAGWEILVVWECETKEQNNLAEKLCEFMATKESQQR
jgi:DNA mismatch endonuclease (patch repair protein)